MPKNITRRTFLETSGAFAWAGAQGARAAAPGPNDRITVGMIAAGSRGQEVLEAVKTVRGTEIVAVCDAYAGRLERAIARTGGRARIFKDHRELLADKRIDTVVIASPDHLHKRHVIESLEAGKDVYCEKPLTYTVEEGLEIQAAVKKSGRLLQVGSQGISSQTQRKAKEFIQSGRLGKVTVIRAAYNRNSASGAWIYPIPPEASPETVNWNLFLGAAPRRPFDLERFFRWRCYEDYSGGIATDLFVHLCTTIHFLMDAKMPSKVAAMGELYRWKESRDVPDTLHAILEYPEGFAVTLGSSFNNQFSPEGSFQVLGTEGTLLIGFSRLRFIPESSREDNGWIVQAWPERLEEQYYQDPEVQRREKQRAPAPTEEEINLRESANAATELHCEQFFRSVRTRTPTVQDALAGHRAAACAHLINDSVRRDTFTYWDFQNERQKT
jgi:predicted dehydrogenase